MWGPRGTVGKQVEPCGEGPCVAVIGTLNSKQGEWSKAFRQKENEINFNFLVS